MTNNTIIIEKLREVKYGILSEIIEKLNEINEITKDFSSTNLKLHDVSYYLCQQVEKGILTIEQCEELFCHICEMEYEMFVEWERENLERVTRHYIGRTSSFYYLCNYQGHILGDYDAELIQKGKGNLNSILEFLQDDIYNYLVLNDTNVDLSEIDEFDIDEEINNLQLLLVDFEDILEIVNEIKMAYDYLKDFKTEESEYALAKEHLYCEIEHIIGENKANELFNELLRMIPYLNEVQSIKLNILEKDNYIMQVVVNEKEILLNTKLPINNEISKYYVELVKSILKNQIESKFNLNN